MTSKIEQCPICQGPALNRDPFGWQTVCENGDEDRAKLHQIIKAVEKYYLALDNRKHGGAAQNQAFSEIESVLGMSWEQGEVKRKLDNNRD